MFNAIYFTEGHDQFRAELRALDDAELEANTPGADVTVEVEYSTINYKDGLALTNKSPVVRKWPMVPGIDCAGTVEASRHPTWKRRRSGRAQRLGRGRDALGRPRADGAAEGRLAGARARRR